MPKATINDLKDFGFRAEQFGTPGDFETATTGYLARLLADVEAFVSDQVGASAYTAASGITLVNIKNAEKYFAAAELYRRREAFKDSNVRIGNSEAAVVTINSRDLNTANEMETLAWDHLARVTGVRFGSGVAIGAVETGPYPASA